MVYVCIADGFEEIEAITPIDLLRRAGVSVRSIAIGTDTPTGAHDISITPDLTEEEALALTDETIEMLIFPGGMPGAENLHASLAVNALIKQTQENDGYLAAICAAPLVLGRRGLLKGKNATCFPGFEEDLTGANITHAPVTIDGNIITSKGAGTSIPFALTLVSLLKGQDEAERIYDAIQLGRS